MMLNVITLFDQTRLRNLIKQRDEQKIDLVLWTGVEGNDIKQNISKSHKGIVEYAKKNNIEKICIAEDDLLLSSRYAYDYFIKHIPDDFDLYFGGLSGGFVDETNNEVSNFSGMFLYVVHQRFYDVFLSADENKNLDRWLGNVYYNSAAVKPVYKACNPLVAKTINGWSAHHACEMDFTNYWKPYKYLEIST